MRVKQIRCVKVTRQNAICDVVFPETASWVGLDLQSPRNHTMPKVTIDESFWRNSPSPVPDDEKGEEGQEWGFEVVGEEVDNKGEVRYEIEWDNWQRADGTSQTWHRMPLCHLREWQQKQRRQRKELVLASIDVDLAPLSGTDLHNTETRLRAQAYAEKLETRRKYDPKLEEQMAELLADKLGPEWESREPDTLSTPATESTPARAGRGLRLSTVRQQQKSNQRLSETDQTSSSKSPSISDTIIPPSQSATKSSKLLPARHTIQSSQQPPPKELTRKRKLSGVEGGSAGPSRNDDDLSRSSGKGKSVLRRDERDDSSPKREELSLRWTTIARSVGAASISFVNDEDDEEIPSLAADFRYLERGYIYSSEIELPNPAFKVGCDCIRCNTPSNCECQSDSEIVSEKGHKRFAYTKAGLFAFNVPRGIEVIECNEICKCDLTCNNRISQRPRDIPLQIFKAKRKGWGVCATVDIIRGKVLGTYAGYLVTRREALKISSTKGGYVFDLDGQEFLEDRDKGNAGTDGKFSVDSRLCGNWTRFVNHSCHPNMIIYLVVYDTLPATNRPYIVFVARKNIEAGTELTVDYDPVSADLQGSERLSPDVKGMKKCTCGSKKCRGYVQMC